MVEVSEAAVIRACELVNAQPAARCEMTADYLFSTISGAALATFVQQASDTAKRISEDAPKAVDPCAYVKMLLGPLILPPDAVDPLLIEAREIVATWWEDNPPKRFSKSTDPTEIRAGKHDDCAELTQALAALMRGMELAAA